MIIIIIYINVYQLSLIKICRKHKIWCPEAQIFHDHKFEKWVEGGTDTYIRALHDIENQDLLFTL